jgi:hypothetical protein
VGRSGGGLCLEQHEAPPGGPTPGGASRKISSKRTDPFKAAARNLGHAARSTDDLDKVIKTIAANLADWLAERADSPGAWFYAQVRDSKRPLTLGSPYRGSGRRGISPPQARLTAEPATADHEHLLLDHPDGRVSLGLACHHEEASPPLLRGGGEASSFYLHCAEQ